MLEQDPRKEFPSKPYLDYEAPDAFKDESISWGRVLGTLWEYRNPMAIALACVIGGSLIIALIAYLTAPVHKVATLQFRLEFEGADRGEYPNGMKFSSAEIISTPILTAMFETNNLKQYTSYEEFKNSVFILESNPELAILSREFQARLADPKLINPVDRERVENEYREKQSSLLRTGYSLNLARNEHSVSMPSALISKVLTDILGVWAEYAAKARGALRYQVPVYSRNILQEEAVEAEDYIIGVDILRSKTNRILSNIDLILTLPGASVIRTGESQSSLDEVRANLEDIAHFKLEPFIGVIQASGLSKDSRAATLYLESRLSQIRFERAETSERIKALQEGLRQYMQSRGSIVASDTRGGGPGGAAALGADRSIPTMIPQFGESFLDRLIELSGQNNDTQYRQGITQQIIEEGLKNASLEKETAYYESLLASLRGFRNDPSGALTPAQFKTQRAKIVAEIVKAVDDTNEIYQEISTRNLNPRTFLYTVTAPVSIAAERSLSLRSVTLYGLVVILISLFVIPLGCLSHNYFRKEVKPSSG